MLRSLHTTLFSLQFLTLHSYVQWVNKLQTMLYTHYIMLRTLATTNKMTRNLTFWDEPWQQEDQRGPPWGCTSSCPDSSSLHTWASAGRVGPHKTPVTTHYYYFSKWYKQHDLNNHLALTIYLGQQMKWRIIYIPVYLHLTWPSSAYQRCGVTTATGSSWRTLVWTLPCVTCCI